jgi:glycosyltransferase involved in cell wall biosynthesis
MTLKVAMISTYKIRCGIASFTETVESLIKADNDVDIFQLDQFNLRNEHPAVERRAEVEFEEMCEKLKGYDVVNLQWEPGLIGLTHQQILRRTRKLFNALAEAKIKTVITVHTVLQFRDLPPIKQNPVWRYFSSQLGGVSYYEYETHELLRWLDARVDMTLICHTPRDRRYFETVVGIRHVVDHPLSYMRKGWKEQIAVDYLEYNEKLRANLPENAVVIGTFGFLSTYKGMEVAIDAMRRLPRNYILLIYGEVHHAAMRIGQHVDPYVDRLMTHVRDKPEWKTLAQSKLKSTGAPKDTETPTYIANDIHVPVQFDTGLIYGSMHDRVRFMGSPDDYEFACAIRSVDICVFPYLEIGQSASGPVSQALELKKKTVLSRTRAFSELSNYYPDNINFFDVGNHIQLAQVLQQLAEDDDGKQPMVRYDNDTLRNFYLNVFQGKNQNWQTKERAI